MKMKKDLVIAFASALVAGATMPILGVYGLLLGFASLVAADLLFNK